MFSFFKKKSTADVGRLWFSTDIHCHILPGVDDGSPDTATSVSLVEAQSRWGIKRVFASPHVTLGVFENTPETIDGPREDLRKALAEKGVSVELNNHAEYRIDDFSLAQIDSPQAMKLPGDYVMIENPFSSEPGLLDKIVFDLQVKGLRPILAHPERYSYYYRRPERYQQLHDAGLLFQVNVLSLAEAYGKEQRKMGEYLMEKGLVDFLGTDMHNLRHVEIIDAYLASRAAASHRRALEGRLMNDKI